MSLQDDIKRRATAIYNDDRYKNEMFQISDALHDIQQQEDLKLAASHLFANEDPQEMLRKFTSRLAQLAGDGLAQTEDREIFRNTWRIMYEIMMQDYQTAQADAEPKPHHAAARNLKGDIESLMALMGIDLPPVRGQGGQDQGRGI